MLDRHRSESLPDVPPEGHREAVGNAHAVPSAMAALLEALSPAGGLRRQLDAFAIVPV